MRYFEEQGYQKLLVKMVEMAAPKTEFVETTAEKSEPQGTEPKVEYISMRKIRVSFDKAWLADEADVDQYLQQLREALLKEIHKGKRIQI